MANVDVFVLPIPKDRVEACKRFSENHPHFWTESGCLSHVECIGDEAPDVQGKDDEVVAVGRVIGPTRLCSRGATGR